MNLKKLGLAGILTAGVLFNNSESNAQVPTLIYPAPPEVIIGPPIYIETLPVIMPSAPRIIIEPPLFIQQSSKPIRRSGPLFFELGNFEPGNYFTVIERENFCEILGGNEKRFQMVPTVPSKITPNYKQNNAWTVQIPGHYELFVSGCGKELKIGCTDLEAGDKIRFVKDSPSLGEGYLIKEDPGAPWKMRVEKEQQIFKSRIKEETSDGIKYRVQERNREGRLLSEYTESTSDNFHSTIPKLSYPDGRIEIYRPLRQGEDLNEVLKQNPLERYTPKKNY